MNPPIKLILVPIDFSEHSERALRYARALAEPLGASLHLLHVVEDLALPGGWTTDIYTRDLGNLQAQLIAEAERRMATYRIGLGSQPEVPTSVTAGHAPTMIAARAAAIGADLIVMGTHGRSGFSHLLMGSVAERVMRVAACPVLTVRGTDEQPGTVSAEHAA